MAEWLNKLPRSTIMADAVGNKVTQPGSVLEVTKISPFKLEISFGFFTTLTFAFTIPGQQLLTG
jgi:hypothetical protein